MTGVRRSATLLLVGGCLLAPAGPALGEELVVRIGRDGVRPQVLQAEPGDVVRFVNDDPTFAYRAQSTGGAWRFDSGPTALLDGDWAVPSPLSAPGTYAYRVAQDPPFAGTVVVAGAPPASTTPTAQPTAQPSAPPVPVVSVTPVPGPVAAPAVPGPLAGRDDHRALGLAVAVGAVLLAGTASLLLRLLLAVPTAVRTAGPVLSDRPARL